MGPPTMTCRTRRGRAYSVVDKATSTCTYARCPSVGKTGIPSPILDMAGWLTTQQFFK